MKRIFSLALVLTMLATMIQVFPVSAVTTLQEWIFCDFEGAKPDWAGTTSTSNVYGIDTYLNNYDAEDLNLNGETGITKTDGLTMEVEFDCKIPDALLSGWDMGGFVVYASTSAGATADEVGKGYSNFYGSVSAVKDTTATNGTGFSKWYNNNDQAFGAAELDKWYRVKMVMPIGDEKTAYTVYVNGEYAGLANQQGVSATDVVKFLCIRAGGAKSFIDNLRVVTYTNSADAPVDKGALIAKLRDFEKIYPGYAENATAAEYITSAKATYKSTTATAEDVTAAIAKINESKTILDSYTTLQEWMFYDFEGTKPDWVERTATSNVYGIGTYRNDYNGESLNLNGTTGITKINGLTMEVEFDCKIGDLLNNNTQGGAVLYVSTGDGENPDDAGKGYSNYYGSVSAVNDTVTNKTGFSKWTNNFDQLFGAAELDKWYRVKMVMPIGDTRQTYSVYIDGVSAGNAQYQQGVSATDVVKFLCIRASGAYSCIDNLKVVTYTAAKDAPVEKGVLIAAIRDFEETYSSYAENETATEYVNKAKEIYEKTSATAEEVEEAMGFLAKAERTLFNAEPLVKEKFNSKPAYFFDEVNGTQYTVSSGIPAGASYSDENTYDIKSALTLSSGSATKNFSETALASVQYITAEVDVKTSGTVSVALSDSVKYDLNGEGIWKRVRFDINTIQKTYNVYVNGEKVITDSVVSEDSLSKLTITSDSEYSVDNATVYSFENANDVVSDKGGLVKELRTSKALLDAGTMTDDEAELMTTIFKKGANVYEAPVVLAADIAAATQKTAFYNKNLSAQMDGAKSVVIPGVGKTINDVVVKLNLHYGSQLGDENYNDIFFDKGVSKDFSDVRFYNVDGQGIQSEVESSGNYEFVEDSKLATSNMHYLSDGTVVAKYLGTVSLSHDNGNSWESTGIVTDNIWFVDRNDNIYHANSSNPEYGPAPIYKMYKDESGNWQSKLVINNCDLLGLETNDPSNPIYNVTTVNWHGWTQDDDGYIYAGRYQGEFTGAAVFVSDESGENFVLADFRPDKQHVHSININRNVYPNEVYVCMDDREHPLCYVTTDHLGYEEIKNIEVHQLPAKARSTGGLGAFQSTDAEHTELYMPKNEEAETVMNNAKQHMTQVPVPYNNSDYFRYFGLIETREEAPEKFYQAENGKWYTYANKEYYNEVSGKTHKYSDNVYGLGTGESNILGGPGVYKTTDIMNPEKYYPVVKNSQGGRQIISPIDGVLAWGGLIGGFEQTYQITLSYDDGETWETAYDTGFIPGVDENGEAYNSAGAGQFRYITRALEHTDGSTEILMNGFGMFATDPSMRAIFGGDNYFGLANVLIPELPEDGLKIFVKADGEIKNPVTNYYYGTIDESTPAIKSVKATEGESEELKFPLVGDGKNMVYSFDIQSEDETGIEMNLMVSDKGGQNSAVKAFINTADGTVSLNDSEAVSCKAVGGTEKISVKLITDENGTARLYVNEDFVCMEEFLTDYISLSSLAFKTVDVSGGDVPSLSNTVTVYYSNVGYAEYTPDEAQFILDKITFEKNGEAIDELAEGVTIKSAVVRKLDTEIDGGVLVVALYDGNGALAQLEAVDITESGSYDINLTAKKDGLTMKFFMLKDLDRTLKPLTLTSCL